MEKRILIINPWIYDFAAYDIWMKPLGLLQISSVLRSMGHEIHFIDCLEGVEEPAKRKMESLYGCRKFKKEEVAKPQALDFVKRRYSRFGISHCEFDSALKSAAKPDLVVIGSMMTYWYPGVIETVKKLKQYFPSVPIILGGKYAQICNGHALRYSGADTVSKASNLKDAVNDILLALGEPDAFNGDLDDGKTIYPVWDIYESLRYACVLTSEGCPFKCTYCYTPVLNNKFIKRDPEEVVGEIEFIRTKYPIKNFAFYDDALNYRADEHLIPILEKIIDKKLDIFLHAPNAMNTRWIDDKLTDLMFKAGFKTVRLGLETSDPEKQKNLGGKVFSSQFEIGIKALRKAGFGKENIGVYLLAGLPGQKAKELYTDIDYCLELGIKPHIAEYSPIPGTPLFEEACKVSRLDMAEEPLYQNNSILPLSNPGFSYENLEELKGYLRKRVASL
jgi:hypothetical protein